MPLQRTPERAMTASLLQRALLTLRERPVPIISLAVLVLVVPQSLEALVSSHAEHLTELREPHPGLLGLVILATSLATSFGFIFYAGVVDFVVGEHQWGHERPSYRHIARHLPWVRLLLADFVVTTVSAFGSLFLVVPGIVIYTFLSLVGPVINIERRGLLASFVRSASLVRARFWLVVRLVTIPVLFEGLTEDLIHSSLPHDRTLAMLLAVCLGVLIAGGIGVIEVTLVHELVRQHPLPQSEPVGAA